MRPGKKYEISYSGLKDGEHLFDFEVGMDLMEDGVNGDLKDCSLKVNVHLQKSDTLLVFNFDIRGNVVLPCDRCLQDLEMEIEVAEKLYVKFGSEAGQESEEVIILPRTEHKIDLSQYIYEFVVLGIPQKKVHDPEDCDPEIMKKIQEYSPEVSEKVDPRWLKLDEIK